MHSVRILDDYGTSKFLKCPRNEDLGTFAQQVEMKQIQEGHIVVRRHRHPEGVITIEIIW